MPLSREAFCRFEDPATHLPAFFAVTVHASASTPKTNLKCSVDRPVASNTKRSSSRHVGSHHATVWENATVRSISVVCQHIDYAGIGVRPATVPFLGTPHWYMRKSVDVPTRWVSQIAPASRLKTNCGRPPCNQHVSNIL